jgi:hypothetical protein
MSSKIILKSRRSLCHNICNKIIILLSSFAISFGSLFSNFIRILLLKLFHIPFVLLCSHFSLKCSLFSSFVSLELLIIKMNFYLISPSIYLSIFSITINNISLKSIYITSIHIEIVSTKVRFCHILYIRIKDLLHLLR